MSKICLKELKRQIRESRIGFTYDEIDDTPSFAVHHEHKWDHGYDYDQEWGGKAYQVEADGTWSPFEATRRIFYQDLFEMLSFLYHYFQETGVEDCIVAPCWKREQYHFGKFFPGNDMCEETAQLLREHGIRRGEQSGMPLSIIHQWQQIALVIEGAFRGYTTLCLFCPSRELLLTPDHHFGVTFHTQHKDREKELVSTLLPEHPTLRIWDGE